jgi:hypothetical protein
MKDYYVDFLVKNSGNTPESEVSKVSEPPFDTFDTYTTQTNDSFLSLERFLEDPKLRDQFDFEVEERTAIMMFDSELRETEAKYLARKCVEEIWIGLFITDLWKD